MGTLKALREKYSAQGAVKVAAPAPVQLPQVEPPVSVVQQLEVAPVSQDPVPVAVSAPNPFAAK